MPTVAALAMIFAVMCINVYGTRSSTSVQTWMTAFKVGAIVLPGIALIATRRPGGRSGRGGRDGGGSGGGEQRRIDVHARGGRDRGDHVLWAYEGWQYVTFSAGETINRRRHSRSASRSAR